MNEPYFSTDAALCDAHHILKKTKEYNDFTDWQIENMCRVLIKYHSILFSLIWQAEEIQKALNKIDAAIDPVVER